MDYSNKLTQLQESMEELIDRMFDLYKNKEAVPFNILLTYLVKMNKNYESLTGVPFVTDEEIKRYTEMKWNNE